MHHKLWPALIGALIFLLSACGNSKSEEINNQGYDLYIQGDYSAAVDVLTEGIAQDSDYADFYTNRAMAYYELGDVEKGLDDLNTAIELEEINPEAYVNRGNIYLGLKLYQEASEDFYTAIAQKDSFDQPLGLYYTYLNLGTLLNQLGNYEEALTVFEKGEEVYNQDPALYNAMGLLYRSLEAYDGAIEAFEKALALDQDYAYAYGNRANIFYLQDRLDLALVDVNTALSLDRYVPQFYDLKAKIHLAGENYDQVEKVVEEGLNIWISYGSLYIDLGDSYMAQERYSEALMQYGMAVQYEDYRGLLLQARAYRLIEDYESALEVIESYRQYDPSNRMADMEEANSLQGLGDYDKAIKLYGKVLLNSPNDSDAKYNMALAYEGLSDYDKAKNLLKEVIADDPDNDEALKELTFLEENY